MSEQLKRPGSKLPTFSSSKKTKPAGAEASGSKTSQTATNTQEKTILKFGAAGSGMKRSGSGSSLGEKSAGRSLFTVGQKTSSTNLNRKATVKPVSKPTTVKPPTRSNLSNRTNTGVAAKNNKPPTIPKTDTAAVASATVSKRPKRAAWDTKGQLLDVQADLQQLTKKIMDIEAQKENQKVELIMDKQQEVTSVQQQFQDQINDLTSSHTKRVTELTTERDNIQTLHDSLTRKNHSIQTELNSVLDKIDELNAEIKINKKEAASLRLDNREYKLEVDKKDKTINQLTTDFSDCREELEKYKNQVLELEGLSRKHETERRKLHNTIQELKGNIRVFCRIRPPLAEEIFNEEMFSYPDLDQKKISLVQTAGMNTTSASDTLRSVKPVDFSFDKVFQPQTNQSDVFDEISQLVQSALDGYNVCIFAYGQTGSGKTYTMQGPDDLTDDTEGMIPKSIKQIFTSTQDLQEDGWKYTINASFLEIYNETIRDLLASTSAKRKGGETKYDIKTASGEVEVTNLTVIEVTSPKQVTDLFERAKSNRAVAETCLNQRSSRSHSVFQLKITGENSLTSEISTGCLNLVDLAGSERLKDSKSEGDRLKETLCINSSLSTLGNVIMALANRKSHIPYRESKLTYLLQNSLGGNSKTLMFVNISPREEHYNETVNSLRFATKVNNCNIGTAQKQAK